MTVFYPSHSKRSHFIYYITYRAFIYKDNTCRTELYLTPISLLHPSEVPLEYFPEMKTVNGKGHGHRQEFGFPEERPDDEPPVVETLFFRAPVIKFSPLIVSLLTSLNTVCPLHHRLLFQYPPAELHRGRVRPPLRSVPAQISSFP